MPAPLDITGQRFGRLTAIAFVRMDRFNKSVWLFVCDCGATAEASASLVKRGVTSSCGCLRKEAARSNGALSHGPVKHGYKTQRNRAPEYAVWVAMKRRTSANASEKDRELYFDRDIRHCEGWGTFKNFISDMGRRPSDGHSIDRIDNSRGYDCGHCDDCKARGATPNCKWSTASEQALNRRPKRWARRPKEEARS